MNLLHPEVEITPGRAGTHPTSVPYNERTKLDGSAVVRLTNDTPQENAYTIRLRCDHPFWQEGWYTIQSLPAAPGAQNAPPSGKPDVRGHGDRSVKVFVPRGGMREILIRFNIPKRPESRAGRYDYVLEVETQITLAQDGVARRKDRLTSLPAVANVRPYYEWSLDLTPERHRVTRRRRTGEFEVIVTNEGNDWLYCDLQLPQPKDLLLNCPTMRLAVPPPEPGELLPAVGMEEGRPGRQRVVPLLATTRLKTFRGELTPQPLSVTAQRVDAPSLPLPPEDGFLSLGSVVANRTTEIQPAPSDRALVYAPPIPAKLLDFFSRGAGSFRAWIAPLLMLAIAIPAMLLVWQKYNFQVKPSTLDVAQAGTDLRIAGPGVLGSKVTLTGQLNGTTPVERVLETKPLDLKSTLITNRCKVFIPKDMDHFRGKLRVERAGGIFSILPPFLAVAQDIDNFTVGSNGPHGTSAVLPVAGPVIGGQSLDIPVQNIEKGATVTVGGKPAKVTNATADTITVMVADIATSAQCPITVTPPDSAPLLPPNPLPASTSRKDYEKQQAAAQQQAKQKAAAQQQATQKAAAQQQATQKAAAQQQATQKVAKNPGRNPPNPYVPPHGNSQAAYTALLSNDFSRALKLAATDDLGKAITAYIDAKQGSTDAAGPLIASIVTSADPRTKALALSAQGWVEYKNGDYKASGQSFKDAVSADSTSLVAQISKYAGDPDAAKAATGLYRLKEKPGLPPATKAMINAEYQKAYKKTNPNGAGGMQQL